MEPPQLTEAEKQLLIAIATLTQRGQVPTRDALEKQGAYHFGMYREDWSIAWAGLLGKELIQSTEAGYVIADSAQALAAEYCRLFPRHRYFYNEYFTRAASSAAHARFCERVYGRDLCQHGMTDMAQLDLLLEILKPGPHSRLLELGCGNGLIAEYISDATGAHVTGVDTSSVGIAQAVERTREKHARLEFVCGDMMTVSFPAAHYDAVIAIDALYFARDLDAMVARMHETLNPQGRMAIFYSSGIGPNPPDGLPTVGTKMSQALDKRGLRYRACDLTAQEKAHWRRKYAAALEMQAEFDAEGSTFLHYWRFIEAQQVQAFLDSERMSRYLYVTGGVGG